MSQVTTTSSERVYVRGTSTTPGYYDTMSSQSKSGWRSAGWILRMFADDKLVRIQACSSELERMGLDPNFPQLVHPGAQRSMGQGWGRELVIEARIVDEGRRASAWALTYLFLTSSP